MAWMLFQQHLADGKTQQAFLDAYWSGHADGHNEFIRPILADARRKDRKQATDGTRKTDAETKAEICCEEFAKFTPADIKKFGKATVYRDVGKFAAERLNLDKPIPEGTVRLLGKKKTARLNRAHSMPYFCIDGDKASCRFVGVGTNHTAITRGFLMPTALLSSRPIF